MIIPLTAMLNWNILTQGEGRVESDAVGKAVNDVLIANGMVSHMRTDGCDRCHMGKPLTGRSRG